MTLKVQLIDLLKQAYAEQRSFVLGLTEAERAAVGSYEQWSAKDNLAHMTAWCEKLVQRLHDVQGGQLWPDEDEAFEHQNERIFAEHREQSWTEVMAWMDRKARPCGGALPAQRSSTPFCI